MPSQEQTAISPTRAEHYAEWYQAVIQAADLAEHSPVRGCMVIKPWGYSLWENIQRILNQRIKETGCQNAYFPLFIPLSLLEKEAQHVAGFAKECAVVTHHRLILDENNHLIPSGKLEEPLIVRPTSETIIGEMFAQWIKSYRDLPLEINQWANVVRWEMRPRLFLRTTEFLWQEGHTAHTTHEEALARTMTQLRLYEQFMKDSLAIPVIPGKKSESEKFPGAEMTFTVEAVMQDGKALQAGTSHDLGQHFSKAARITFLNEHNLLEHPWTTSWGATTRLIGGMIMTHSDDNGLIVPPRIAPLHLVILPVVHKDTDRTLVLETCSQLEKALKRLSYHGQPLEIRIDTRDLRGGEKRWSWIKKGVPILVEIGPREAQSKMVTVSNRDVQEKRVISQEELIQTATRELDDLQQRLYDRALAMQRRHCITIDSQSDFAQFFEHGEGLAFCHWNGNPTIEEEVKTKWGVTIRCLPLDLPSEPGTCIFSGEPSQRRVIFARAY